MGVEVAVHDLTKSFGKQRIWGDVTLTLPPGEISVLLGPSGTGKSVFLKSLIGLLKPDKGSIVIRDVDVANCSERKLYETRKLFGVLFQDGALFGSMNLFDNIAFPLREHTKKSEKEIADIVNEKMEMVGLAGRREEAARRDLRRYAQARRAGPRAGPRPRDHPVRRAGLGPRPRPRRLPQPAHRRPQRADRRDVPHRHARHRHRPHGARQPRHAVPPRAGHVRPARGAAHQRGAGGQAVPQRPPRRPDRHERGEGLRAGRRRARRAGRQRPAPRRRRPEGRAGHRRAAADPAHRPACRERKAVARRQQRVLEMLHTLPAGGPGRDQEVDGRGARDRGAGPSQSTEQRPATPSADGQPAAHPSPDRRADAATHRRAARPDGFAVAGRWSAAGGPPVRAVPRRLPADVQAALPGPRVHPAGLVHRQRHDRPDRPGRDPVRRGHRAATRHAWPRRSARSRSSASAERAGHRPRGQPDRRARC